MNPKYLSRENSSLCYEKSVRLCSNYMPRIYQDNLIIFKDMGLLLWSVILLPYLTYYTVQHGHKP